MDLLTFLNQPIVLTLLTLLIGSYLFTILNERRSKQDKIRDKAIEFVIEVSDDINLIMSRVFGHIRNSNANVNKDQKLKDSIGNLFSKRLGVQIKSRAYLNTDIFWRKYEIIIWEIRSIIEAIDMVNNTNKEEVSSFVKDRMQRLAETWPISNDDAITSKLEYPFNDLLSYAHMISDRIILLFSDNLKNAFK